MVLTAVDWSGDAGAESEGPNEPGFVAFAFVSIEEDDLDILRSALSSVRRQHGFEQDHIFKHMKSNELVKQDFFAVLRDVRIDIRVLLIDKALDWSEDMWKMRGNDRIAASLAEGASRLPTRLVSRQTLLLDLDQRRDGRFATQIIKAVHRSTRRPGSPGFHRIKCCPDSDPTLGDVVQVADMIAGVVRRHRSVRPPAYPDLTRIILAS